MLKNALATVLVLTLLTLLAAPPRSDARQQTSAGSSDNSSSTEQEKANRYGAETMDLFNQDQFDALDLLANDARTSKARFLGGGWKLYSIYVNLGIIADNISSASYLGKIQRWVAARPTSITARIALADFYVRYAWRARGEGSGETVSSRRRKLFEERLALARKTLEGASALYEKCPHWYVVMQNVALGQGWGKAEAHQLFEDAIAFEPEYQYFYSGYAHYLLPQWAGKDGEMESFASDTAKELGGDRGDYIYFVIATRVCEKNLTVLKKMSWPKIQAGYAALERHYGTIAVKMNVLAYIAVKMNDPNVAKKMFDQIGEEWDSPWESKEEFEMDKGWANKEAALSKNEEPRTASAEDNLLTSQGRAYNEVFTREFDNQLEPLVKKCVAVYESGNKFLNVYFQLNSDGKVTSTRVLAAGAVAQCFVSNLGKFAPLSFTPPPEGPYYWVERKLQVTR